MNVGMLEVIVVIFNNKNREQKKWWNVTGFLQRSAVSEKSPGDTRLYASALVSLGEMGDPFGYFGHSHVM